ncbi:MAG TPA: amidohydrolase family protein [Stellaceae bacterium]|nr:amidohydrolase family protein [Stellaceae bacterium]
MTKFIFSNARVFDGWDGTLADRDVLVEDGVIRAVEPRGLAVEGAEIVDCAGRVLMPGMIDAHTHIYAASLDLAKLVAAPVTYTAHYAPHFMRHALDCGFTTIRDVAAGDIGAARALREGLITGPRLFYGGRALSQTGGHGDVRSAEHDGWSECCACPSAHGNNMFAIIVDGVDAARKATREELRRGASHIKIMGSGGVASPTDPLERCQFSDEEIAAIVDEATRWGSYVAAHCHPTEAVRRCVALGVRSIEHGTLIDQPTADFVAGREAFIVPTLATIFALKEDGLKLGLPPVSYEKLLRVADRALEGIGIMSRAGVRMGFGTDLLGGQHVRQCTEFTLRAQVLKPLEILRSACSINAELMGQEDRLGCIKPGAEADLLVVDGNPLEDISVLAADGRKLSAVMLRGRFHKRTL